MENIFGINFNLNSLIADSISKDNELRIIFQPENAKDETRFKNKKKSELIENLESYPHPREIRNIAGIDIFFYKVPSFRNDIDIKINKVDIMIYLLKYFNLKAKQQNATNDTERDQAVLAISPDTWSNNLYKNKQFFIDARDGELFRDYNYGIPNLKLYLDTSKDKSFFNYYVTHGFDWNQFNDYGEAARTFKDKVMYMNTRSSGELNIFKELLDNFATYSVGGLFFNPSTTEL